jgi:cobalamin biosynthesis Mg chelatase CobN
MRGKAALVVGLATGYVLGTRDGRARYQQIKSQANRFLQDPRVQQKATQATELAKEKAPLVKDKVAGVTQKATSKASSKVGKHSSGDSGTSSTSSTGSDLPSQTTTSAPDLTQSSSDAGSSGTSVEDSADGDAIVLTPPSPSPLAPGPTQTNSSSPTTGGPNG